MIGKLIHRIKTHFSPDLKHYELGKSFVECSGRCECNTTERVNKTQNWVSFFELDFGEIISIDSKKYIVDSIQITSTNKRKTVYFYKLKEIVEIDGGLQCVGL